MAGSNLGGERLGKRKLEEGERRNFKHLKGKTKSKKGNKDNDKGTKFEREAEKAAKKTKKGTKKNKGEKTTKVEKMNRGTPLFGNRKNKTTN